MRTQLKIKQSVQGDNKGTGIGLHAAQFHKYDHLPGLPVQTPGNQEQNRKRETTHQGEDLKCRKFTKTQGSHP